MNERQCNTCADWDASPQFYTCFGSCGRAAGNAGQASDDTSLAFAADAEMYNACLCTKATFGCVQWRAKEREEKP